MTGTYFPLTSETLIITGLWLSALASRAHNDQSQVSPSLPGLLTHSVPVLWTGFDPGDKATWGKKSTFIQFQGQWPGCLDIPRNDDHDHVMGSLYLHNTVPVFVVRVVPGLQIGQVTIIEERTGVNIKAGGPGCYSTLLMMSPDDVIMITSDHSGQLWWSWALFWPPPPLCTAHSHSQASPLAPNSICSTFK